MSLVATGGSAGKAIQVLLDHGVKEEKIFFLNLIAAPEGIKALTSKWPKITIITTEGMMTSFSSAIINRLLSAT